MSKWGWALAFDTEGHGFYEKAHEREYYTRLLDFLARPLGAEEATPAAAAARGAERPPRARCADRARQASLPSGRARLVRARFDLV